MWRALLTVVSFAWLAGCTEYHPRPAPQAKKKIEILRARPPGHHATAALEAVAGTAEKARERLMRDGDKEGCDALVLTGEDADSFEYHGDQVPRHTARADCIVRDTPLDPLGRPRRLRRRH